jgi:hypothetical protein
MTKLADLLDALEEAEGALTDALYSSLDGDKGLEVLKKISRLLVLHDRKSRLRKIEFARKPVKKKDDDWSV